MGHNNWTRKACGLAIERRHSIILSWSTTYYGTMTILHIRLNLFCKNHIRRSRYVRTWYRHKIVYVCAMRVLVTCTMSGSTWQRQKNCPIKVSLANGKWYSPFHFYNTSWPHTSANIGQATTYANRMCHAYCTHSTRIIFFFLPSWNLQTNLAYEHQFFPNQICLLFFEKVNLLFVWMKLSY